MKSKVYKLITENLWLKVVSLALAAILWFFIVSKGRSVIVLDAPIEFKDVPVNLEVINAPRAVSLDIEGHERLLKRLKREDVRVVIDLSNFKNGKTFYTLHADNIKLPSTLTIAKISPQTIKFMIEKIAKKWVPVKPVIVGLPMEGYSIRKVEVFPRFVEIKGPQSIIAKTYAVKTEPIDVTEISDNLQYRAYLDISTKNISVDNPEIEVNVTVKKGR